MIPGVVGAGFGTDKRCVAVDGLEFHCPPISPHILSDMDCFAPGSKEREQGT